VSNLSLKSVSESYLDAVYPLISDQLNTGIILIDLDFNILMWNRFFGVHAHKDVDNVVGHSVFNIFPELPERWFKRKISGVVQLKTPTFCSWEQRHHLFELTHSRPITTDSDFMAQNCTFFPIINNDKVESVCVLIEDVTDVCYYQEKLQATLEALALSNRIDGLTQIYNRKHWEVRLNEEYVRARRHSKRLSLIMFDLDHFKVLNDNYGHQGGDMVLVETAKIIKSLLRSADVFGRYGGEEFSIILPETDLQGAAEVAEKIRKAIDESVIDYKNQTISYSVSVGVAELKVSDGCYEDLISNADIALYKAKASGRNRICLLEE